MQTEDIILEELRGLRADYNKHARATGERLSKLESQMQTLLGNGQPGIITKLQDEVKDIQRWRWRIVGLSAGIGIVVSGAISAVAWLFKG